MARRPHVLSSLVGGAGDRIRTDDILLGKQTLCQLSYTRIEKMLARPDGPVYRLAVATRTRGPYVTCPS